MPDKFVNLERDIARIAFGAIVLAVTAGASVGVMVSKFLDRRKDK